jgi:probable O-glycosylation ligase (exosortase A-associated)
LRLLVWVVTLSVVFFGFKGGIFTVLTGGSHRVWGPPDGMLSGNNEFAVGLVMLIPMLYWLRQTDGRRWVRHLLTAAMVLSVLSILGTQSRGALVAVLAMAFFLGLKSQAPVRMSLLLLVMVAMAIAFMPDSWNQRMDSIGDYREDESAQSRLWTWHTMWNVAVDRPLFGAGFRADALFIFKRYAPLTQTGEAFLAADKSWVAHSIYFQMLGEHGFVGLFFFLGLWTAVWLRAGTLAKKAEAVPDLAPWMPSLMRMVQVGVLGYGAGGAFLSLAYLDLPYYLMGFVLLAEVFLKRSTVDARAKAAARPTPAAAASAQGQVHVRGGR